MSYILDALRRAEADRERERGHVPGLHAQPRTGGSAAPAAAVPRRWLPWAGGGAFFLLLAGAGAGSWWASSAPAPLAPPSPRQAQPAASAGLADAMPKPVPVPVPVAAPQTQLANSGTPEAPSSSSAPAALARPATAPPTAPSPPLPARSPAAAPALTAASAAAPIPRLAELPESTRRELPKLAISGSVYSEDPASRFLIANGEVLREGHKLGPELVLEQIRPHELVLRYKGQAYRQAY